MIFQKQMESTARQVVSTFSLNRGLPESIKREECNNVPGFFPMQKKLKKRGKQEQKIKTMIGEEQFIEKT